MRREVLLPAAFLLDAVAGDPEWFPHPVRIMGLAIARGETLLRRPGQSDRTQFLLGATLTCVVAGGTYLLTGRLLRGVSSRSSWLGDLAGLALGWTCLAGRNLQDEAAAVLHALDCGNLPHARQRLARIVGRDTEHLAEDEIARALIETLAESASDGVVAPMFYLALGGVPLAMAYKAVNTMDSMIGHADQRYFYFGKFAARLDDVMNFLPARLTASCMVASASILPGSSGREALGIWRRDGERHKSPNAGQPESAMAGALQVQLGGRNYYAGEPLDAPLLGAGLPAPTTAKARAAGRLVVACSLLALAVLTASAHARRR